MLSIQEDVVLVTGGRLGDAPASAWVVPVEKLDGHRFVYVDRVASNVRKMLGNDFGMLDHITKLRNAASDSLMLRICGKEADPLQDDDARNLPKRPRKDMIDEIPKYTTVKVETGDGREQRVLVRTAAGARSKLGIELSLENLQLLCCTPAVRDEDEEVKETPQIEDAHVHWMPSRGCVYARYYDKPSSNWRIKSMAVKQGQGFQERVDKAVKLCRDFYDANHHVKDKDCGDGN